MKKNKTAKTENTNETTTTDTSPKIYQRSKLKHELSLLERELTEKQKYIIGQKGNRVHNQFFNYEKRIHFLRLQKSNSPQLG